MGFWSQGLEASRSASSSDAVLATRISLGKSEAQGPRFSRGFQFGVSEGVSVRGSLSTIQPLNGAN